MIKLNWYALTKPHVVHRYYRIKEALFEEGMYLSLQRGEYIFKSRRELHNLERLDRERNAVYVSEKDNSMASALYCQNHKQYTLTLPNRDIDKDIYIAARDVFASTGPSNMEQLEDKILPIIRGTSVTLTKTMW